MALTLLHGHARIDLAPSTQRVTSTRTLGLPVFRKHHLRVLRRRFCTLVGCRFDISVSSITKLWDSRRTGWLKSLEAARRPEAPGWSRYRRSPYLAESGLCTAHTHSPRLDLERRIHAASYRHGYCFGPEPNMKAGSNRDPRPNMKATRTRSSSCSTDRSERITLRRSRVDTTRTWPTLSRLDGPILPDSRWRSVVLEQGLGLNECDLLLSYLEGLWGYLIYFSRNSISEASITSIRHRWRLAYVASVATWHAPVRGTHAFAQRSEQLWLGRVDR